MSSYERALARQKDRVNARQAEREAMAQRLAVVKPTDPCRRCAVRPEHHDEFGCARYSEQLLA